MIGKRLKEVRKIKGLTQAQVAELVGALIVSKPGSPTIAPESDKRKPFDRLAEAKKDFE